MVTDRSRSSDVPDRHPSPRGESDVLLSLQDAAVGYASGPALGGVNIEIRRGDLWGIVGPNGAGKSTLLKTLLGILPPLQGDLEMAPTIRFGYVPQRSRLDPIFPLSALQVVALGAMGTAANGGTSLRQASRRVALAALDRLGVASLEKKPFRSLSGGQQQRVLIARGLVREPDILMLDEPTSGMDIPSGRDVIDFLDDLNRKQRVAVLFVTHRLEEISGHSSRIALMDMASGLFATGPVGELVTSTRLSALYGRTMEVALAGEERMVRAAPRRRDEEGRP